MQKKIFEYLLDQKDFGALLADGAVDLTPSQLARVKETAKEQSEDELLKRKMAAATEPGYRESVLAPSIMNIFKNIGGQKEQQPIDSLHEETRQPEPAKTPAISETTKNTSGKILNTIGSPTPMGITDKTTDLQLLNMIYDLMVKKQEIETSDYEQYLSRDEEREKRLQQNHDDIVAALTGFSNKEIPAQESSKKKIPKKEKKPKHQTGMTVTKPGKSGLFSKPSGKSGLFSKPNAPSGVFTGGSVAGRVAVGAAVGVGISAVATSVGAVESGRAGGYNATFGDEVQKNGKIVNKKGYISTQKAFGKNLTEMTLEEVKQFGQMRSKVSKNSGAVGKYQFMPTTLFGETRGGKFYPGLVQELDIPMTALFDGPLQEKLYKRLESRNNATLKTAGVPLTPGYQYMATYIGAGGAIAVYQNRDKDMTVAQAMIGAGYTPPGKENNPELYKIKTYQFEKILEGRLNSVKKPDAPAVTPNKQGEKLSQDSVQNKLLKDDAAITQAVTNNNTTNITLQQKTAEKRPQEDDTNPYERKLKYG